MLAIISTLLILAYVAFSFWFLIMTNKSNEKLNALYEGLKSERNEMGP